MTEEELALIESRLNAATPGPWVAHQFVVRGPIHDGDWGLTRLVSINKADATFIAHARTDVETLLAEVRRSKGIEEKFLDYMNSLIAADSTAIRELLRARFQCNKPLSDHPICQVRIDADLVASVSALGVLCGLAEELVEKRLAAVFEDEVLLRFEMRSVSDFSPK